MGESQLVMYDEDYRRILAVVQRLVRDANAKGVFVVDRNGQLIGEAGEMRGIDTTSLASLTAGCIAATGGLAKLVGEDDFPVHFHQGQRDNLHITLVSNRIILVVIFDDHSSLGLVRLRVKKAGAELADLEAARKEKELLTSTVRPAEADAYAPASLVVDIQVNQLVNHDGDRRVVGARATLPKARCGITGDLWR